MASTQTEDEASHFAILRIQCDLIRQRGPHKKKRQTLHQIRTKLPTLRPFTCSAKDPELRSVTSLVQHDCGQKNNFSLSKELDRKNVEE